MAGGADQGEACRGTTAVSSEFVGINFNFSQYIQDNVEEYGRQGRQLHQDRGSRSRNPGKAGSMAEMAQVPEITDLGTFWILGQPNLNIRIDRERAARYGLNVANAQ